MRASRQGLAIQYKTKHDTINRLVNLEKQVGEIPLKSNVIFCWNANLKYMTHINFRSSPDVDLYQLLSCKFILHWPLDDHSERPL